MQSPGSWLAEAQARAHVRGGPPGEPCPLPTRRRSPGRAARWVLVALLAALLAGLAWGAGPAHANASAPGDLSSGFGGFGSNGLVVGGQFTGRGLAVAPDGKLVIVGRGSANSLHVLRYLSNGQLDDSFGEAGSVSIAPPAGIAGLAPQDVVVRPNGKVVIVGRTSFLDTTPSSDFLVVQLTAGGEPDPSFGAGGLVVTDFNEGYDGADAAALQLDGKLVVAGTTKTGTESSDFAVARYNLNGTLDDNSDGDGGFGGDGKVTITFDTYDAAHAVAVQLDGKVVVAGDSLIGGDYDFAVARLEPDGKLDDNSDGDGGFSGEGKVTTGFGGHELALAVAVQSDGQLVAAGRSTSGSPSSGHLARYTSTGSLDTSFDSDGKLTFPGETVVDLALQLDGRIVLLGGQTLPDSKQTIRLRRLMTSGAPDNSFDTDGVAVLDLGGDDVAGELALLPDGRSVTLGQRDGSLVLARLGLDGARHEVSGQVAHGLGFPLSYAPGYHETANGLAVQANGVFYVAGEVFEPGNEWSAAFLTRFLPNGQPDGAFGSTGSGTVQFGPGIYNTAKAVVVQPDGKVIAAGYSAFSADYAIADLLVARYLPTGELDEDFGVGGTYLVDFANGPDAGLALALASDGKVVIAGNVWNGVAYDWGVARLTSAGLPDPAFDGDGLKVLGLGVSNGLNAVVVLPNRQILVAGHIGGDFAIARLTEAGELDATFGAGGLAVKNLGGTDVINALAVAPDGWIYAAGYRNLNGNADLAVAQYTPGGQSVECHDPGQCAQWPTAVFYLDVSVGDYAYALDVRADGQLVAAGCLNQHFAGVQLPTHGAPTPLNLNTDFLGYPDCAKAVKFTGGNQVLMAGEQGLYPYGTGTNLALASFQTTPASVSTATRVFLPFVIR